MIPEGWQEAKLQDVAPVIDCKHKTPRYAAQGVPIVSPGNLAWGALKLDGCRTITEADYTEMMDHCSVAIGDVVFGRNQSVGVSSIVTSDSPFALGQDTVLIKPTSISTGFLHQWLQSRQFELSILRLQGGSTFGRINLKDLRAVPTPVPPFNEADRIAETLHTWDRAIETVEALIANASAQKQALMRQLLTSKRRLPGFDLPWSERSLESIFQFKKGQGLSKGVVTPEGVRPCILYGELYTRYPEVIRAVVGRTNANDGFPSKKGDVLIPASTTTTGIDLANATAILESDVLLSGDINILRPKNTKQCAPFFAYLLTHTLKQKIASRAQGITIVHLYGAHLKPLTVTIPDVEEQHAIASIIMDADDEILRLEAQLAALRQEKAALMQQLLTGKRRVKLPESENA